MKLAAWKIFRSNGRKPGLPWTLGPRRPLREARVTSIPESGPTGSFLPYLDPTVVSLRYSSRLTSRFELEGKERTFSHYPPATIISIAEFPEIIRKSLPRSFLRAASLFGVAATSVVTVDWYQRVFIAYAQIFTDADRYICIRLFAGQRFHSRGYPLFPAVFSSQRALMYSEHKRCSQITVPLYDAASTPANTVFPTINPREM